MAEDVTSGEVIKVLRGCRIFSGMSEHTERLLADMVPISFSAGEIIAGHRDFFAAAWCAAFRKSEYLRARQRTARALNRIGTGDVFGAAAVFFAEPKHVSTVVAAAKCRILFIERGCLETIIKSDFSVASAYIEFLSGKICFLNKKNHRVYR